MLNIMELLKIHGEISKQASKLQVKLDRFDYNLKWNKAIEAGSLVVGKEVELVIDLQLVKKS